MYGFDFLSCEMYMLFADPLISCSTDFYCTTEVDEGQGPYNNPVWLLLQLCSGMSDG